MNLKKNALNAIGNTPLVRLEKVVPSNSAEVWVKLEGGNPTGSYKDRMAFSVLTSAIERGELSPGDTVIEYTGGSTGTALAFVSAVLGLKFIAVFSDAFSKSKQRAMEAFGAEVIVIKSQDGVITPDLIQRMKLRAYEMGEKPNTYYADQFGSPEVRSGYKPLGMEIAQKLDGELDLFCSAVGTGAALMGSYDGLVESHVQVDLIAFEPLQSPFLTTGKGGPHLVEGIGVGFEPPFLDRSKLKQIRAIDQKQAVKMCQRLARKEGLFCGGSTGLNVVAAIELAKEIGPGKRIVTLGCDNGMKYLGSHIYM